MIDRDEAEALLEAEGHLFLLPDSAAATEAGVEIDAGRVLQIYLDDYTGWPSFATVASFHAGRETLVALHEAERREQGDGVRVPYDRDKVDQAPTIGTGEDLSIAVEDALFDYYAVPMDGVVPVVDHLGSVLVPYETTAAQPVVVEHDVDHPPSTAT